MILNKNITPLINYSYQKPTFNCMFKRPKNIVNLNKSVFLSKTKASDIRSSRLFVNNNNNSQLRKINYQSENNHWAVYIANLSYLNSQSNRNEQFYFIEKCLSRYFSVPNIYILQTYKELVEKSKLENLEFNDFYSITKLINVKVLHYVSLYCFF